MNKSGRCRIEAENIVNNATHNGDHLKTWDYFVKNDGRLQLFWKHDGFSANLARDMNCNFAFMNDSTAWRGLYLLIFRFWNYCLLSVFGIVCSCSYHLMVFSWWLLRNSACLWCVHENFAATENIKAWALWIWHDTTWMRLFFCRFDSMRHWECWNLDWIGPHLR